MEATPTPDGAPETTPAKSELPTVESPPLSPGETIIAAQAPAAETVAPPVEAMSATDSVHAPEAKKISIAWPHIALRPRHRRYTILAASVTFAAAFGAVLGALASGGFSAPPRNDAALVEENKAMQQSIAALGKEIGTLKANLEQANKSAHSQFAKISERLQQAAAEVTGSISAPQTTTVQAKSPPVPLPRPAPRMAAAEPPPVNTVVPGWTIWRVRNGYVYVAGRGEVFEASIGAVLPGLGPVQSVRRQDGHWMVQTPRGIIVSLRDTMRERYYDDY